MATERLQKVLAAAGVASRRASEVLIANGRVTVDGKPAKLGMQVDPAKAIIAVDGKVIGAASAPEYLMLHKPGGVTSTVRDRHASKTVLDMIPTAMLPEGGRLYPVGRLDQDSEGLLVLTNDGAWADRVLHPRHGIEREYAIGLRTPLSPDQVKAIKAGIPLDEGLATLTGLRATTEIETRRLIELISPPPGNLTWYRAILAQGWKRQLRRMFGAVGAPIDRLVRVRMGPVRLDELQSGRARRLRAPEVRGLGAGAGVSRAGVKTATDQRRVAEPAARPAAVNEPRQLREGALLWQPSEAFKAASTMTDYMDWLERERGLRFADYAELWRWSVDDLAGFWSSVVDYYEIPLRGAWTEVLGDATMPGARWFDGAQLNYAEALLRRVVPDRPALLFASERSPLREVSGAELQAAVAAAAGGLRRLGVGRGDRVVAMIPNIPEAVVGLLACASIGAIWSSCSPDFGARGLIDRFAQISPKVLIAVDGYTYGGKPFDRREVVAELRAELPTLERTVLIPYLDPGAGRRWPRRDDLGRPARRAGGAAHLRTRARSTTRSGSCTRRARPACRRRSSMATAASCSNTRRRSA